MALVLVLGGIRSGKSEYAERLAATLGPGVVYLATGEGGDGEMAERIALHRARRSPAWRTVESADPLASLGQDLSGAGTDTVLVDGLTGWLCAAMAANQLFVEGAVAAWGSAAAVGNQRVLAAVGDFAVAAASRVATTIVVADEVGWGGVALGAAARRFADLAGEAAQVLAQAAQAVWLVAAGQAIALKPDGGPLLTGTAGLQNPALGPGISAPPSLRLRAEAGDGPAAPLFTGRPDAREADVRQTRHLRLHGDTEVPPGCLDFAVNVWPAPAPAQVLAGLAGALADAGRYPNESAARAALARRHGRSPEEVLLLNGAAEAFWLLASVLAPRQAVCVHPSFTEPEVALRSLGRPVSRLLRRPDQFSLDLAQLHPAADLIVVGNPNNPTGNLEPAGLLERLVAPGRVVVVDEAFMAFVPGESESLAARGDLPGLVVVRSLTKLWALPGIRAGYLLAPADLVARLAAGRQPWAVNVLAVAALEAYGLGVDQGSGIAQEVVRARTELAEALSQLPGVQVWPSAANFLLLAVPDGPAARRGLLERGIGVRRADTFPGLSAQHLRVAVRGSEDNHKLLTALSEVLR